MGLYSFQFEFIRFKVPNKAADAGKPSWIWTRKTRKPSPRSVGFDADDNGHSRQVQSVYSQIDRRVSGASCLLPMSHMKKKKTPPSQGLKWRAQEVNSKEMRLTSSSWRKHKDSTPTPGYHIPPNLRIDYVHSTKGGWESLFQKVWRDDSSITCLRASAPAPGHLFPTFGRVPL